MEFPVANPGKLSISLVRLNRYYVTTRNAKVIASSKNLNNRIVFKKYNRALPHNGADRNKN